MIGGGGARGSRMRVAAVSFEQRPLSRPEEFDARVRAHVRYATDYGARVVLFPEYVGSSLLSLGGDFASWKPRLLGLFEELAVETGAILVAGSHPETEGGATRNTAFVFPPEGGVIRQAKLHCTPYEREQWGYEGADELRLFPTPAGLAAVAVCYDVEFPELVRAAARAGAVILLVPSWTDDVQGSWRVRHCAAARCVENQIFAVCAPLTGGLPGVPAFEQGRGQAAILSPCDLGFAEGGVVAAGRWHGDDCVVAEIDTAALAEARAKGTVTTLADSRDASRYVVVG